MSKPVKVDGKPIDLVSNTIRLKKGKSYMMVIERRSGLSMDEVSKFLEALRGAGFNFLGLVVEDADGVKVIEQD